MPVKEDREIMIKIEHLRKSFGSQKVLDNVSLDIRRGETMVIIGGSGQGKSVILKHIIGLLNPDGGRIFIENREITNARKTEIFDIRERLGMLFQGAALFDSMSVGENLSFPLRERGRREKKPMLRKDIDAIVRKNLALVGLSGIEEKMPSELSGGMKKRVGLARVLVMSPTVIMYDEPTTGLDPITSDVINDLILDMQRKLEVTSIVVTHDMVSAYKIASENGRISMLREGRIIFTGTVNEVKSTKNPYVRQFIEGRRKLQYDGTLATDNEKKAYQAKFDISKLK
ncbi:MAG: ABC transporter ATP-binding protein [Fibrobacterota bacterium]